MLQQERQIKEMYKKVSCTCNFCLLIRPIDFFMAVLVAVAVLHYLTINK